MCRAPDLGIRISRQWHCLTTAHTIGLSSSTALWLTCAARGASAILSQVFQKGHSNQISTCIVISERAESLLQGASSGHSHPFYFAWILFSMATQRSACRPPRHRLAETRSCQPVTCILCASANLICSPLLPTPQKHKEPFLPPSPPHKSKQENWTANGLRIPLWGQTLALGQGYSLAHLTGCKYLYACFSCKKQYRAMHVHNKKCKPKGIHWKTSLPPSLTLGFPPQRKQLLLDYFALWML